MVDVSLLPYSGCQTAFHARFPVSREHVSGVGRRNEAPRRTWEKNLWYPGYCSPAPPPQKSFFCGISVSARFKSNGNSWIFNYISERILFSVNFIGWKKWDSCPLKGRLLFIVVCKIGEPPQRLMKTSSRNVAINIPKWLHRETNEKGPTCGLLPPQAVCVTTLKGSWVKLLCASFQSWHGRVRISWERWEL